MKLSNNFDLREFIPPIIYNQYGVSSIWYIRPHLVKVAQFTRTYFGKPITINNWYKGGSFTERGFRLPDSTTGARLSQHKLGGAFDFTVEGMTPNEVRYAILKDEQTFLEQGLTTLEHEDYATTWVHADIRWTNMNKILIVRPYIALEVSELSVDPSQNEYFTFENGELIPLIFPLI